MMDENKLIDQHVGERLSGYIDGELTQQERQMVDLHCEQCEDCRSNRQELLDLRQRIGKASLSPIGEDKWRETMNDSSVQTSQKVGWILLLGGLLAALGVGLLAFISSTDMGLGEKLMILAIYGGLASLLYSVLRQRLIERKTDKYKDVEI